MNTSGDKGNNVAAAQWVPKLSSTTAFFYHYGFSFNMSKNLLWLTIRPISSDTKFTDVIDTDAKLLRLMQHDHKNSTDGS